MAISLLEQYKNFRTPSLLEKDFLINLETQIAQDLWQSAGGHWSQESIDIFRIKALRKLAEKVDSAGDSEVSALWVEVVRDFHQTFWGEKRLEKKEKKEKTEEQRIFWELFSYIWVLLQAVFITKTAVFYFGIKSAQEDSSEGKIYVLLAILFSFISLAWFAYRKSKKK